MNIYKTILMTLSLIVSSNAFAGQWKICSLSANGGEVVEKTWARTFSECRQKGLALAQDTCSDQKFRSVVRGQFTVGNPEYFTVGVRCNPISPNQPL